MPAGDAPGANGDAERLEARVREALAAGQASAAATLALQALGNEILGFLRAVLRETSLAEDAFQEFAEDLWRGLPGFRWDAALRTWVYRLAANAASDQRRDPWRRRGRRLATAEYSTLAQQIFTSSPVRRERQLRALEALRERLEPDERALLVLRLDRRMSWQEIAQVLSVPGAALEAGTVAKRFERLKERLGRDARRLGLVE